MTRRTFLTPRRIQMIVTLLLVAGLCWGFGMIAEEVIEGDTLVVDKAILMWFRDAANPSVPLGPHWLVEASRDVTALGSYTVLGVLVVGLVLHLLLTNAKRTALFLTVSVVGGALISSVLKYLFDRPRPDLTGAVEVFTASFPSGHATTSAVVYLTIGAILAERTKSWGLRAYYIGFAAFLSLVIGCSRVYLGVHYPTDVLAGWSIGTAWALLCLAAALALRPGPHANEAESVPPLEAEAATVLAEEPDARRVQPAGTGAAGSISPAARRSLHSAEGMSSAK